jgi:ADP-ribose pyrophosphatase YjhB (NUDIX family)
MMTARGPLIKLWRKAKPLQWRLVWLSNAKFVCGVCAVVRADDGRILLLRHRLWPPHHQWGFPGGWAKAGERHEDTVAREVREETSLEVKVGRLLKVRSGFRYRVEFYYEATLAGGLDRLALETSEILEARLFSLDDLPGEMPHFHRELALALAAQAAEG